MDGVLFGADTKDSLLEIIEDTMLKVEDGIFPSPHGLYRKVARLLKKNHEICMDSEKILKTIIWELGPQLEAFPHIEYLSMDGQEVLIHETINQINLVNLLINGLDAGNDFIKHLIVMLYRIYYPKQYKQYKKFSQADRNFVTSFLYSPEIEKNPEAEEKGALELMMALFVALADDKELSPEAYAYFSFAEYLDLQETKEENPRKKQFTNKDYINTAESILKWLDDEESIFSKELEYYQSLIDIMDDDGTSLMIRESVEQMINSPKGRPFLTTALYQSVEAVSQIFPNKEHPSQKRLASAFIIYCFLLHIKCDNNKLNHELGYLSGINYSEQTDPFFSRFKEKKVKSHQTAPSEKTMSKLDELSQNSSRIAVPKEKNTLELEEELSQIKQRSKSNERRMKNFRMDFEKVKEENEILKKELEALQSEHFENVKIREYLYSLTDEDNLLENDDNLEGQLQALKQSRIVIIGGYDNWTNKLKRIFPDWDYLATDNFSTQTANILNYADGIFFFTEYLSHKAYYKYMSYIRNHNLNFGYLHSVNIEMTIKQIWKSLEK